MATIKKLIQDAPRMRGVTPVPNGPLVKKKGEFKGSTLKAGGKIKKAQTGASLSGITSKTKNNEAEKANLAKFQNSINDSIVKADQLKHINDEYDKSLEKQAMAKSNTKYKPIEQKYKAGGKVKKNWIQGAVNPAHKGFCTPLSKKTCTPKRKALALTFKAMGRARKAK